MGKQRKRLDELLVEQGLTDSRSQAKRLILAGKVRHGTEVLDKAGKEFPVDWALSVEEAPKYVSRGAGKLAGYLERYPWEISGKRFLDVGASTGGFSDYLLQAGAVSGTCVDVGHGQLHYKLRQDPRITNLERINARYLKAEQLPHPDYPIIVMDLSFISLRRILPVVWPLLQPDGLMVALIKPQFEAGKKDADRHRGVIKDPDLREKIRREILEFAEEHLDNSSLIGCCDSPLPGMNGNVEYLAGWSRQQGVDS